MINLASAFSSHLLNYVGLLVLMEPREAPNFQWLVRQALTNRQNFAVDVAPLQSKGLTGRLSQEALTDPFNLWKRDVVLKLIVKTVNVASLFLMLRQVSHTRIATFLSKNPVLVALPVIVKAAEFALEYFNYFHRNNPHASVEMLREKFEQVGPYLDAFSHATFAWAFYHVSIKNVNKELAQSLSSYKVVSVAMNAIAALLLLLKNQGKPRSYEVSAAVARLNLTFTPQNQLDAESIWIQAQSSAIDKSDQLALLEAIRDKAFTCLQNFCQHLLTITGTIPDLEHWKQTYGIPDRPFYNVINSPALFPVPAALVALQTELKTMKEVIEQGYMKNAGELGSFEMQRRALQTKSNDVKDLNTSPDVQKLLKAMLPTLLQDLPSQQACQALAQDTSRESQMKAGQYFFAFDSLKEIDSSNATLKQAIATLRPVAERLSLISRNR